MQYIIHKMIFDEGTDMSNSSLFVDLPNIYSQLIRSGIGTPSTLREYFMDWFAFDTLAKHLEGHPLNTWVFYSGNKIGPSHARIDNKYLRDYIDRINSQVGVTARDVNIPGEQREPIRITCEKCNEETTTEWISEKGIDSSLTVHLFDTMDSWNSAYLFAGDADYIPVVNSLRRRGKFVAVVGFKDTAKALIRECYNFIEIGENFISEDFTAYTLFREEGLIQKWLTTLLPVENVDDQRTQLIIHWTKNPENVYQLTLFAKGQYNSQPLYDIKKAAHLKSPFLNIHLSEDGNRLVFSFQYNVWRNVWDNIQILIDFIQNNLDQDAVDYIERDGGRIKILFTYDKKKKKYSVVK